MCTTVVRDLRARKRKRTKKESRLAYATRFAFGFLSCRFLSSRSLPHPSPKAPSHGSGTNPCCASLRTTLAPLNIASSFCAHTRSPPCPPRGGETPLTGGCGGCGGCCGNIGCIAGFPEGERAAEAGGPGIPRPSMGTCAKNKVGRRATAAWQLERLVLGCRLASEPLPRPRWRLT